MADPVEELPPGFEALGADAAAPSDEQPPGYEALPSTEEQSTQDESRLTTLFSNAQLDKGNVDQKAAVLRLSKDSGVATDVIEKNYEGIAGTWRAAKFDPKAWRTANPELAKLVLEQPHLGTVVMRDTELNVLSKALNALHDTFWDSYISNERTVDKLNHVEPAQSIEPFAAQDQLERAARDAPKQEAFLEDNKSKLVKNEGGMQRALVPVYRMLESKQQLDVQKAQFSLWNLRNAGGDTYELEKQILDMKRQAVRRDYDEGAAGQVASDVAEQVPGTIDMLAKAGIAGVGAGAIAGAATFAATRNPTAARMAALRVGSAASKGGVALATFQQSTGQAYGDFLDAKDDTGKPLDEGVARAAAGIYGTFSAGVAVASWAPMLKAMGPLGALISSGSEKAAVAAMVKDAGFMALSKRFAKNWAGTTAVMGAQGFLQEAAKEVADYFARSTSQGFLSAKSDVDAQKLGSATAKGLEGGAAFGAAEVTIDATTHLLLRDRSEAAKQQVAEVQKAGPTPTVKADPAAAAQVVANVTAKHGEPVESYFVTPERLVEEAQKAKLDPARLATELLGEDGPKKLRDALEQGGKLEVSGADYMEKWAQHPIGEALKDDTTTGPSLLTGAELAAEKKAEAESPTAAAVRGDFEASPSGDQLNDVFVDPDTGLLNRQGYDVSARDKAYPFEARFKAEGQKFFNDVGHDYSVFDGLIRRGAEVLKGEQLVAMREGGELGARVKDQAQADALAEKMTAATGGKVRFSARTEEARAEGRGAHRGSPPVAFLKPGEHEAFGRAAAAVEAQAAPELADVATTKGAIERATAETAKLRDEIKATAKGEPVPLTAQHARAFNKLGTRGAFEASHLTPEGLYTKLGWERVRRVDPKAHVVVADARSFGDMRKALGTDELGTHAMDALASAFFSAMRAALSPDDDLSRPNPTGDELFGQTADRARVDADLEKVASKLKKTTFYFERADGRVFVQEGLQFVHGFGKDEHAAGAELEPLKRDQVVRKPEVVDREELVRRIERARGRGDGLIDLGPAARRRSEVGSSEARGRSSRAAEVAAAPSPFDVEVAQQQRQMGLLPMFRSAADAGMTGAEWQSYLAHQRDAASHASRVAELAAAKEAQRATENWYREALAHERAGAEEDYERLPARRAQQFLRGDAAESAMRVNLNRAAVEKAVGEEASRRLPVANDGVMPDEVADFFGYPTGDAMLKELAQLPDKAAWSKSTAEARMSEKYPSAIEDRQQFNAIVDAGLHGSFTEKWLVSELDALGKRSHVMVDNPETGRRTAVPFERLGRPLSARDQTLARAREIVSERPINRLDAGVILQQERAAADAALRAAAKGDLALAYVEKQQQLLNHFLWREVRDAAELRDKFVKLTSEMAADTARARLDKARPIYRDGADLVLEAIGAKSPEQRDAPLPSLGEVTTAIVADGNTVGDVSEVGTVLAQKRQMKDLTVGQMRQVHGLLKNIDAAARNLNTALVDGKRVAREGVREQLIAEAQKNLPDLGAPESSLSARTWWQSFKSGLASIDGSLLKMETMIRWLGGSDPNSMWQRAVGDVLQGAKHREADILQGTIAPIVDVFADTPAALRSRFMERIDGASLFPTHRNDLTPPTRLFELLMMTFNAGTESNLSRLLDGRGITEPQLVDAINKHLTPKDLEWVQTVWNQMESLWPESSALEERDSGLVPEKLEKRKLVTKHGTLEGGYFPAVYDRRVERAGERQMAQAIAELFDPGYTRPGTPHSHLKSRVEGFTGAIALEPSIIARHLAQVAHDIAFREAIKSVANLVLDENVQRVLQRRLGDERSSQFLTYLKDVGQMRAAESSAHVGQIMRLVRGLKGNTVTAALGYALPNAIEDLSNLPASVIATDLKATHLAAALFEFGKAPLETIDTVEGLSGELRSRRDQLQRDLSHQIRDITKSGALGLRALRFVKDHAFTFMEFSDRMSSTAIWLGRYRQGLAEGAPHEDAVRAADTAVRRSLPSHSAVDRAGLLRDQGYIGAVTMFYGFWSTAYNVARDITHDLHTAEEWSDKAKALPRVSGKLIAYMTVIGAVSELLRGRGRQGDEGWDQWYLRKMLASTLSLVPFGGDVGNAVENGLLHKDPNPRARSLGAVAVSLGAAIADLPNDDKESEQKARQLLQAIAPIAGLPISLPMRAGGYAYDAAQGNVDVRGPGDVVGGLLYGQREDGPANLPTMLQDAVSQ